jgi:hypothetical protein
MSRVFIAQHFSKRLLWKLVFGEFVGLALEGVPEPFYTQARRSDQEIISMKSSINEAILRQARLWSPL